MSPNLTLSDEHARRLITEDTGSTLFVSAGAGAGKTTALISRILTLVLRDEVPIERIAAVTFTDRAAEDLRGKIRVRLEGEVREEDAERARRAERALAGLDLAAIGTLHSFAQRILNEHAIEAGLPPAVQVSDQMAGAIAAQQRWSRLRADLMQDPAGWNLFEAALELELTERHLRTLATRLDADADLIPRRILAGAPRTPLPPTPLLAPLVQEARDLVAQLGACTDGGDKLAVRILQLEAWADDCPSGSGQDAATDGSEADALIRAIAWLGAHPSTKVGNVGNKGNWTKGYPLADLRAQVALLGERADLLIAEVQDGVLRRLAAWFGTRILTAAEERRRSGRLEFHDLLIGARDLLRSSPAARAALHERYPHLLLDEFQDTDPLQIEIAARIAGGADADQEDWRDIRVPAGSLFVVGDPKQSIYRFRRADIGLFLDARSVIGRSIALITNFRSGRGIIDWINAVFSQVIEESPGLQPAYEELAPFRDGLDPALGGPAVAVLGAEAHPPVEGKAMSSEAVREIEAEEVAGAIRQALRDGWLVTEQRRRPDGTQEEMQRPVALGDITLLVPTRTSLGAIEAALDAAGLGYRTEAASLVLADPDVLALRAAARAVADPTDRFTLVTALRAPQFACGDDDLFTWVRDGGVFDLRLDPPEHLREHPVAEAMAGLRELHRDAYRLSPSEVLERIIRERRMFEIAGIGPRARESIRRLRYVVEQARAWSDVEHGGLRSFLDWLDDQAEESQQSAEAVLPETDTDGIRITTIHASKGLDFPVVIMSGLGSLPGGPKELRVHWGAEPAPVEIVAKQGLSTRGGPEADAREKEVGTAERARLLYVAATRARDHLVVSLHRPAQKPAAKSSETAATSRSSADWLVQAGALEHGAVEIRPQASDGMQDSASELRLPAPPDRQEWEESIRRAQKRSRLPWSTSASMLEGSDDAVWKAVQTREAVQTRAAGVLPGTAPDAAQPVAAPFGEEHDRVLDRAQDLQALPAGGGPAVGNAVHEVLQGAPFSRDGATRTDDAELVARVRTACTAHGATAHEGRVLALVRAALAHPLLRRAASATRHWREMYVGVPVEAPAPEDGDPTGHTVRDGIIDLLIEEPDGTLTVVDYKTDDVPPEAIDVRTAYYAPQLREYRRMLEQVTGRTVGRCVLLFLSPEGGTEKEVALPR